MNTARANSVTPSPTTTGTRGAMKTLSAVGRDEVPAPGAGGTGREAAGGAGRPDPAGEPGVTPGAASGRGRGLAGDGVTWGGNGGSSGGRLENNPSDGVDVGGDDTD